MFFFSPPWENKHCTYKIKPQLSVSITWRGQGHGSTVILKLTCSLKRRGSWQRSTYAKRGGRARWVGGGRRWKDRRRRRKRKDETDCSYPTRYPEWQPGNEGSIKAALGGQSEEQADGLSSAPSSARYAPLPVNNPLPSLFHVSFFFFSLCLSLMSQSWGKNKGALIITFPHPCSLAYLWAGRGCI